MSADQVPERRPQGAWRLSDASVLWRVWAPLCKRVVLRMHAKQRSIAVNMQAEAGDCFVHQERSVDEGLRYAFELDDGQAYPDPASRWQPEGIHAASAVFSPQAFSWSDRDWPGIARDSLAIYELHVGTFTPEGTFDAVIPRLPALFELGVTALEIMPVAQFPGTRNWGYDGVHPYAVQNSYGGPHGLQRLVDAAHRAGLAVMLDVVYNHFGPEGNYAGKFAPYLTDRYHTPWGNAINYDGPDSDRVRQFVVDNACMWVRDFHVDGLRLDAVQTIYDFSPRHILADIQTAVQQEAARARRVVHVIAETNQNDVRLVVPPEQGGCGLDGMWSDDFHHSLHALLTGERSGYYCDFGRPEQLVKAWNEVFVYDGCYSPYYRRRHGTRAGAVERSKFVICRQNHDQVGNRAHGERLAALLSPAAERLSCALLLLAPCTPLLFMGEEYGERRPFPFFCSFLDPGLAEGVRKGRRAEFAATAFAWGAEIPDPQAPETFAAATLQWSWPSGSAHAQLRQLYRDLLAARRDWPALRTGQSTTARLAETPAAASLLVIERGGSEGLLVLANLTPQAQPLPKLERNCGALLLSTENVCYGGLRGDDVALDRLLPYEALVFGQRKGAP